MILTAIKRNNYNFKNKKNISENRRSFQAVLKNKNKKKTKTKYLLFNFPVSTSKWNLKK